MLGAILDAEVTSLAGPKGRHDPQRSAVRHGSDDGLVALGGRLVSITRPRVRTADRSAEVALPTYDLVASTELLGRMAMERMLAKVSTQLRSKSQRSPLTSLAACAEPFCRRVSHSARRVASTASVAHLIT